MSADPIHEGAAYEGAANGVGVDLVDRKIHRPLRDLAIALDIGFSSMLDVGCGRARADMWFARSEISEAPRRYVGLEVDEDIARYLEGQGVEVRSPEELHDDDVFDLTFSAEILEHLKPEETRGFLESVEVRTAKVAAFTTPNFEYWDRLNPRSGMEELRWVPDHFSFFDEDSTDPHVHKQGFEPQSLYDALAEVFVPDVWHISVHRAWPWRLFDSSVGTEFDVAFKLFAFAWKRDLGSVFPDEPERSGGRAFGPTPRKQVTEAHPAVNEADVPKPPKPAPRLQGTPDFVEGSSRLVRNETGAVYLIEGDVRRWVPSTLIVRALEPLFGEVTQEPASRTESLHIGDPVDLVEATSGTFLVAGGVSHPVRGVLKPRTVSDEDLERFARSTAVLDMSRIGRDRPQTPPTDTPRRPASQTSGPPAGGSADAKVAPSLARRTWRKASPYIPGPARDALRSAAKTLSRGSSRKPGT